MPVVEHAAAVGHLFGIDPLSVHAATLADQVLYAAHLAAIARLLAQWRQTG